MIDSSVLPSVRLWGQNPNIVSTAETVDDPATTGQVDVGGTEKTKQGTLSGGCPNYGADERGLRKDTANLESWESMGYEYWRGATEPF
jgi:hypothetical protein